MSTLTGPGRPQGATPPAPMDFSAGAMGFVSRPPVTPVDPVRRSARLESAVVFGITGGLLFALGCWTTLDLHVVYYDAASRLAHVYMVLWNRPAKLAAIGFVWPPLQTLALLPFVAIKPLATSLVALPLFAAICGGVLLMTLNRTLALLEVGWRWRYPLVILAGLNPLFADYASNGMAEILYLMLLTLGLHYFVSWYLGGGTSYRKLAVSGTFMGLGFLARYELIAWMVVMALCIGVVRWPQRRRWSDLEAPLLIFLAPGFYMCAVWSVISMQVVGGGPLSWLTRAGDQTQGPGIPHPHILPLAGDVFALTAQVSPALWVVPAGLIVLAIIRGDALAGWLATLVLVGAGVTFLLVLWRPATGLLQPRYNIRSLPAMMIGAGWLLRSVRPGIARTATSAVLLAALLAAVPLAFRMEQHDPHQFEERAWATAVSTGHRDTGDPDIDGAAVGITSYRRLANWVNAHITHEKQVLIDDAAFPDVILLSGRPKLFVSRVDHGDVYWRHVLNHPWGQVRYMIVANPADNSAGFSADLVEAADPSAYRGGFPGTHVVCVTKLGAVLAVDAHEPLAQLLSGARSGSFTPQSTTSRLRDARSAHA